MVLKKFIKKGFALVEVLIGISLLSATIVTISALTISMLRANTLNKNHLIATELSREGLEIVKIIRDGNFINYRDWLSGIYSGGDDYEFTVSKNTFGDFEAHSILNTNSGALYSHDAVPYYSSDSSGGGMTLFSRVITVSPSLRNNGKVGGELYDSSLEADDILKVTVKSQVTWIERGSEKNVTLYTQLTDYHS